MTLADHISAEATIAYSLAVPCLGALLGLIIASVADLVRRRRVARRRAQKWEGVLQ